MNMYDGEKSENTIERNYGETRVGGFRSLLDLAI